MTDDKMDAHLRAAGERWRAANTTTVDAPDSHEVPLGTPPRRHLGHRWITAASAAVVTAAIVLGAALAFRHEGGGGAGPRVPEAEHSLVGTTWHLPIGNATLTFTSATMRYAYLCDTTVYKVRIDRSQVTVGGHVVPQASACKHPAPPPAAQPMLQRLDSIVTGSFRWSIDGNDLTLTKDGVGSIRLGTRDASTPPLTGTTWHIGQIIDAHGTQLGKVDASATLLIGSSGKLSANDQCNLLSGHVQVGRSQVVFRTVGATERACLDPVLMAGAAVLDNLLSGTTSYDIVGSTLMLYKPGSRESAAYRLAPSAPSSPLVGKTWQLTNVRFGDHVYQHGAAPATPVTLGFTGTTYATSYRCFTTHGTAALGPDTVVFNAAHADQHSCPALPDQQTRVAEAEEVQAVDGLLVGGVPWTLDGTKLTFTKDDGSLTFTSSSSAAVTAHPWMLVSTEKTDSNSASGSSAVSLSRLTFDGSGGFTVQHRCYTNAGSADIGAGTMTLTDVKLKLAIPCTSNAETPQGQRENDFVDTLLTGHVAWSVDNDTLTITNGGKAATFAP